LKQGVDEQADGTDCEFGSTRRSRKPVPVGKTCFVSDITQIRRSSIGDDNQ